MTNLFKQAHSLTRATIQAGDDYRATFGLCLKQVIADAKQSAAPAAPAPTYSTLPVKTGAKTSYNVDAIKEAGLAAIVFLIICLMMAIFAGITSGLNSVSDREYKERHQSIDYAVSVEHNASYNAMIDELQAIATANMVHASIYSIANR